MRYSYKSHTELHTTPDVGKKVALCVAAELWALQPSDLTKKTGIR